MPPKFYKKKTSTSTKNESNFKKTGEFLIIVESPSKCKSIESYLGSNYNVIASKGHICSLNHLKDIDMKNNYETTYHIIDAKRNHINYMKGVISQYSKENIIIATDDDREGAGIAYHICIIFDLPTSTTKQIKFNEITKPSIQKAIQNITKLDMNLVQAQQARQILDLMIGFKISPILWKYIYHSKSNSLSAGRCQTPALCLIYENYKELQKKESERKYKTTGYFFEQNISCELNKEFDTTIEINRFLEESKDYNHTYTLGERKESKKTPPKPFNTSRLLQSSNNVLHLSPKMTMSVAQTLYQNGHITYMRTENTKYSKEFLTVMEKYIETQYTKEYQGNYTVLVNTDSNNPHEGIRVTNPNIQFIKSQDSKTDALYKMIWRNTIESCMSEARYNTYKITINAPQEYTYTHTIEIPIFLGWKKVSEKIDVTMEQQICSAFLQQLKTKVNPVAPVKFIDSIVVMRNKHQHYTESTLIQRLEELGIGRPSTYSMFVETIQDRGYVNKKNIEGKVERCIDFRLKDKKIEEKVLEKTFGNEKNKLVIEPTGILCIEFLVKHFDKLFDYGYTKRMEEELDVIANGESEKWYNICEITLENIKDLIKPISKIEKQKYAIDEKHELVFQQYGASIKFKNAEGKVEYLPVKKEIKIDLEKLKNQEYTLDELLEYKQSLLGQYQELPLHLHIGQYGPYVQWGENRKSIKDINKALSEITIQDAIRFIENTDENDEDECGSDEEPKERKKMEESSKTILRVLDTNFSIRRGRFGHYVFYKTLQMTKPQFLSIKKFPEKYLDCEKGILMEWLKTTYKL